VRQVCAGAEEEPHGGAATGASAKSLVKSWANFVVPVLARRVVSCGSRSDEAKTMLRLCSLHGGTKDGSAKDDESVFCCDALVTARELVIFKRHGELGNDLVEAKVRTCSISWILA
jgi:hypothetical protein